MAVDHDSRWYALQIQPNTEHTTAERLDRLGFVDTYSPVAKIDIERRGRMTNVEVPAFPTYLLCRMPATNEAWRTVSDTKGVNRLLGKDAEGTPTPLRRGEVDSIRHRELLDELEPPRAKTLKPNCTCRVRFGHLANFVGTYLRRVGQRAHIRLSLLGREVEVTLPVRALEPV